MRALGKSLHDGGRGPNPSHIGILEPVWAERTPPGVEHPLVLPVFTFPNVMADPVDIGAPARRVVQVRRRSAKVR